MKIVLTYPDLSEAETKRKVDWIMQIAVGAVRPSPLNGVIDVEVQHDLVTVAEEETP